MAGFGTELRQRLSRADVLLFGAGLAGLVLFVALLPGQHPLGAARHEISAAEAAEAAEAFLADKGYAVEGLVRSVSMRHNDRLLLALQRDMGRPEARRGLAAEAVLPVFFWQVVYESAPGTVGQRTFHIVELDAGGVPWRFRNIGDISTGPALADTRRLDRPALAALAGDDGAARTRLRALPDSLLRAGLRFDFDGAGLAPADTGFVAALAAGQAPPLGLAAAEALARYHLGRTRWQPAAFRVDSVWLAAGQGVRRATVRLERTAPLMGQGVRLELDIFATGALYEMDAVFEPGETDEGPVQIAAQLVAGGLAGLLGLIFVVAFFRRLMARQIDGRAALVDGVVVGLIVAVGLGLVDDFGTEQLAAAWLRVLARLAAALVIGTFAGLFTILVSGAADSMARAVWPAKVRTASLVRLGAYRNVYMGRALLRGTTLALLLLGLTAAVLALFPDAALRLGDSDDTRFLAFSSLQPMTSKAANSGAAAFLYSVLVLLGVGTFVYRITAKGSAVIGVIALVVALTLGSIADLDPVGYDLGLSALTGLVLGWAFWRFDFLTAFLTWFVAVLLWHLAEGWLVAGSPAWIDLLLGVLFVAGLFVMGLVGVGSGRTRREMGEYVPAYIRELTQEERIKQELEIARQVQASLLPRRMPAVEGLDVAAMCLAALEIGGDYYDFVEVAPGQLAVVIGDVSGKGTQAAFYMTLTKGILQTLAREQLPPARVLARLNELFCEIAPRGTFISMIYGIFDVEARTFTFARAGHNPLIYRPVRGDEAGLVQPAGLGIGLTPTSLFAATLEETTLTLRHGDVLVFYTDGFSEAMNGKKDLYGDDRLARKVGQVAERGAGEILRAVSEDVHHFLEAAGRHDDMTMVVVKLTRPARRPEATAVEQAAAGA